MKLITTMVTRQVGLGRFKLGAMALLEKIMASSQVSLVSNQNPHSHLPGLTPPPLSLFFFSGTRLFVAERASISRS